MDYYVHNSSKHPVLRQLRAARPTHDGHKQYITKDQLRLITGRPVRLTEAQVKANLPELLEKEAQGLLVVKTVEGKPVSLKTLEVGEKPAPAVVVPNFPMDSIANDKQNVGQLIARFDGGSGTPPSSLPDMGIDYEEPVIAAPQEEVLEEVHEEAAHDLPEEIEHVERKRGGRRRRSDINKIDI